MPTIQIERQIIQFIAWSTILMGVSQIGFSDYLLPLLGAPVEATASHLLATLGFFLIIVSGTLLLAFKHSAALPVVLIWSITQKIGASLFMAWGIYKGVFSMLVLGIVLFDFASGLLMFDFRRRHQQALNEVIHD